MKIKTSELEGAALNYCTALACGVGINLNGKEIRVDDWNRKDDRMIWSPSTDWSQGGPLIDRYIGLTQTRTHCKPYAETSCGNRDGYAVGDTLLIAACRAIVAAKLGDTVDVPDELL